jgi:hypothetical protein
MNTVEFKSIPEFFAQEKAGVKPNSVRICDNDEDTRFEAMKNGEAKIVRIKNSVTGETFERAIEDVTIWNDIYIISWRHPYGANERAQG